MKIKKENLGFSMVELIAVIAIMVVLVGIATPLLIYHIEKARVAADQANVHSAKATARLDYISTKQSGQVTYYYNGNDVQANASGISGYGKSKNEDASGELTGAIGMPKDGYVKVIINGENNIQAFWEKGGSSSGGSVADNGSGGSSSDSSQGGSGSASGGYTEDSGEDGGSASEETGTSGGSSGLTEEQRQATSIFINDMNKERTKADDYTISHGYGTYFDGILANVNKNGKTWKEGETVSEDGKVYVSLGGARSHDSNAKTMAEVYEITSNKEQFAIITADTRTFSYEEISKTPGTIEKGTVVKDGSDYYITLKETDSSTKTSDTNYYVKIHM